MLVEFDMAPPIIKEAEPKIIYDTAVLINAIYQMKIEPTQQGTVPKRLAKKIYPLLKGEERLDYGETNVYLDFLYSVLKSLQLVTEVKPPIPGLKTAYGPGTQLSAWSKMTVAQQVRRFLEQWQTYYGWYEIDRFPPSYFRVFNVDRKKARTTLLKHLQSCKPTQWYTFDGLLRHIWQQDPLGTMATLPQHLQKQEERKVRSSYEEWKEQNKAIYLNMFFGNLFELGMVDIGLPEPQEGNTVYALEGGFRLTALGEAALTESTPQTESVEEEGVQRNLIIQPNFEILVLQPHIPTLYSLLPFTQINQINLVSNLTLTQAALLQGQARGLTMEQIITTLEQQSQKDIPQNVLYTLKDWARQKHTTNITMKIVLEVSDEEIAQRLNSHAELQKLGIQQLSPTILLINAEMNMQKLHTILEQENVITQYSGRFPGHDHYGNLYH